MYVTKSTMQSPAFICSRCLRSSQKLHLALPPRYTILATNRLSRASSAYPSSGVTASKRPTKRPGAYSQATHSRSRTYSTEQHSYTPITTSTLSPPPSTPSPPTSIPSPITPVPPPHLAPAQENTTTAILNPRFSSEDSTKALHIVITPRAAHRLSTLMSTDSNPHLALRITVESGGCHGFQYTMSIVSSPTQIDLDDDTIFAYDLDPQEIQAGGGKQEAMRRAEGKAKVVMDFASLELLEGSKVDYTMELIGSQFKIVDNPRATSSCGCGTSFDIKM